MFVTVNSRLAFAGQNQIDKLCHLIIIFILVRHGTYILMFGRGTFTGSSCQTRRIFHLSDYIDPVECYVSLFPLYLRGQGRISYLRIEDGRIHPFVFEIDSSLSIRSGRKDNPGSIDLFWASEQNDHRINGINPDIHHRPVRQFRSEGIQYDSFLKLIITGRILAIAGKITPYRSQAS